MTKLCTRALTLNPEYEYPFVIQVYDTKISGDRELYPYSLDIPTGSILRGILFRYR